MRELVSPLLLLVTALSASLAFAPARGHGQAPSDTAEPASYKVAIERGVSEFERSNYDEAREQFARAHALYPNARTLRGLGMVEFELRNYVDAVVYLEAALEAAAKPLAGALRDETEALLGRARAYVGTLQLRVSPPSAQVSVDGFPVAEQARANLRLPVGDHVLEFQADGHAAQRRAIKLRGEQVLLLEIRLAPALAAGASAASHERGADRAPSAAPTPVYKRWWLWTTVGLVAAGGIVAAVLLTRDPERDEQPVVTANTPPGAAIYPLGSR